MKRALALALLFVCGGLIGCATAIIGGGSSQCDERDSRDCPKQEAR